MSQYDLEIKNARIEGYEDLVNIRILDGEIAKIASVFANSSEEITVLNSYDAKGHLVSPGFFESHIHLDKACILDRCTIEEGTLEEAVEQTGKAKKSFTEDDVYQRAANVVEMAIKKGTMGIRTFVETDPKTELRSLKAIQKVRQQYAFAIDIEICAFAQEGLTGSIATQHLIKKALENGADLIGGCPYKDEDPSAHIEMIFDIAQEYDVDVDFHLDFDLDPENSSIPKIAEEVRKRAYQGRVSIGHVTKLSAMTAEQKKKMFSLLMEAKITLTVLPATDIFLNGRDYRKLIPRGMVNANELANFGIRTTISSNNILNAFTPFGDASLLRMGNMYANIAQIAKDDELEEVYRMIGENAARLLGTYKPIKEGSPATLLILETNSSIDVVRRIAQPIAGFKNGTQTFSNEPAIILKTE